MKVDDFSKIFESMKDNDISELVIKEGRRLYEIRRGGIKQNIVAGGAHPIMHAASQPAYVAPSSAAPMAVDTEPSKDKKVESQSDGLHEIKSPLVGTFYSSPKPDSPPFVEVGDKIKKGQTLCIVEAMKNFNEIESDVTGVVKEICVSGSELVEFGKVLFRVEVQ